MTSIATPLPAIEPPAPRYRAVAIAGPFRFGVQDTRTGHVHMASDSEDSVRRLAISLNEIEARPMSTLPPRRRRRIGLWVGLAVAAGIAAIVIIAANDDGGCSGIRVTTLGSHIQNAEATQFAQDTCRAMRRAGVR